MPHHETLTKTRGRRRLRHERPHSPAARRLCLCVKAASLAAVHPRPHADLPAEASLQQTRPLSPPRSCRTPRLLASSCPRVHSYPSPSSGGGGGGGRGGALPEATPSRRRPNNSSSGASSGSALQLPPRCINVTSVRALRCHSLALGEGFAGPVHRHKWAPDQ